MQIIEIVDDFIQNKIDQTKILIFAFITFVIFYTINFEIFNIFSTDYQLRYKPNGINYIDQLINFNFTEINFLNFYLIPELITGILLKITPNELYFSIVSNLVNIVFLFLSFEFFFKSLIIKNKNYVILIFLMIFFMYVANWQWCFWKLADIYFLFIFSLIFYLTCETIKKKKISYFFCTFFLCLISLIIKPQGIISLPFLFLGLISFFDLKKINLVKLLFLLFLLYCFIYPIFIFILTKTNSPNFLHVFVHFMSKGYISATVIYTYNDFLNQFLLETNKLTEIIYYYFLFFKKIIYQLTFIRETYSTNHNIFLLFYCLTIYGFIICNFNHLKNNNRIFLSLTLLVNLLSILLHSSLNTADEPNRHQLFNLVPIYILVSISVLRYKNTLLLNLKKISNN